LYRVLRASIDKESDSCSTTLDLSEKETDEFTRLYHLRRIINLQQ